MSLVDDAKRLADTNPHEAGWQCPFCGMPNGRHSGFGDRHHADCPWLAMPRIVAALEAAERVIDGDYFDVPKADFDALATALRGERVTP
jgi:hypothetical protein